MPELEYFATLEESLGLVGDFCAAGFRIVPDRLLDAPRQTEFTTVNDELTSALRTKGAFFICGAFTRLPVFYSKLEAGAEKGKYYPDHLILGPILQCLMSRVVEIDEAPTLVGGSLSLQDTFENPETGRRERSTVQAKAAYRRLASLLKKRCPPLRSQVTIHVGPEARKLLAAGSIRLGARAGKVERPFVLNDPRLAAE
jgi:hypothetical protein